MSRDDDDWVGEPPEGHHSREQSRPDFWRNQWQATAAAAVLGFLILVVVLLIVLG